MKLYLTLSTALASLAIPASRAMSVEIPPAPNTPVQAQSALGVPQHAPGTVQSRPSLPNPPAAAAANPNPKVAAAVTATSDPPRPDHWRYKYSGNRWWYWTPENRWMIYGQTGWVYPEAEGGYTTAYAAPVAPPADTGVAVTVPAPSYTYVPGATYYPSYGYYYPRRYYYGGPGVYIGGPRWGVRVGGWW